MSVVGNVITVIGTSAHVPKFVPPVTHFYEIDPPTPSFTGRSNVLTTIHSRMHVCSRNVKWNERTVVLCGLGGIGKTEIERMYAKELKSEAFIKNVAWIDADNRTCLKRSFNALAVVLNVSTNQTDDLDATVTGVYKHFSEHIGNGLFIFDNAPQFNDGEFQILNYLPTSESLKRRPLVLITSRDQVWEEIPPKNKINVHELSNDESVALFTKKLKLRLDQQSWNNKNAILKLAEAFQGFPLGLSLAASNIDYLDELDLENEIEEYLKRMEMPQGGWGDDTQSGAATKYSLVMKNVWEITLTRIKAKEPDGGDAVKLLNLMAFSPTENMTVASMSEVFEFVFGKSVTTKSFAILKKKSMISIDTLSGSLATTVKSNGKQTQKIIRIHKLVQQCTRDNLTKDDAYFVLTGICNYVSNTKLENDASHITTALICAHNHLKIRNWPQDSITHSVIFCSLMVVLEDQNSGILFKLIKDVYTHLNIESKELIDMQTEDKTINLFCLCLIWINKHNDFYLGYKTLLNNRILRKENFENAVNLFKMHVRQPGNQITDKMELQERHNYLYNHWYHTLYTLMTAEKKQRILNATSKAMLKYRLIMESVMDDENFKSDDILEQASKLAERDANDKFTFLCKPTQGNELIQQRTELTQKIRIIFREFQNINNYNKAKSRQSSLESASFLQLPAAEALSKTFQWGNKINGFPSRKSHAAVAVSNAIYSFGGYSSDFSSYSRDVMDVLVLNINEQEQGWKKVSIAKRFLPPYSSTPTERSGHSAVAHKEFVLIFGGWDTKKQKYSNSTYRFNTKTLKWDKPNVTRNIPGARWYHTAVVLGNKMFVYGGDGDEVTNDVHSLDLESFCWSTIETKGIPTSLRYGHSATVHDDRLILFFGGFDYKENKLVNTLHSFDVIYKTWTAVETRGTPPSSRIKHCAFVHSGLMHIFGGWEGNYFNDVFSYDPETFEWKTVTLNGEAPSPRESAGCVEVNDQVFIFGGEDEEECCNDTNVLQM